MRRITLWSLSTITILVLLFSYRTSLSTAAGSSVAVGTVSTGSAANGPNPPQASSPPSPTTEPEPTPSTKGTPKTKITSTSPRGVTTAKPHPSSSARAPRPVQSYLGSVVGTNYGPVQVKITVVGGKLTKSIAAQVPWSGSRDREINSQAVPVLNSEAVRAQSASIDMVSGATFTSEGYIQSLQAALDRAHL